MMEDDQQDQKSEKRAQEGERLARFLAHAGVASRRHAEALIAAGRVQVNGTKVTALGTRIHPQHDRVTVDGKPVQPAARHIYIMLHKPVGYITTAHDQYHRPTVLDLLPPEIRKMRVYPAGRLDLDTSGLLLLTNDGDFALHMTHPRYAMEKRYEALVQGRPTEQTLTLLRQGIMITEDDGRPYRSSPAQVQLLHTIGADSWLALTIHEGRKRQIRRMLEAVGHPVRQLVRVAIGPLILRDLPVGAWRYLNEAEVRALREGKVGTN
jgi:pseudouridine synthase